MTFRGAKDVGFIKDFISEYASNGLNPINDPVKDNPEIRAAQNDKYIFIYLPTSGIINFDDLGIKVNECKIMDLDKRRIIQGKVENNVLQMSSVIEDELVIVGK